MEVSCFADGHTVISSGICPSTNYSLVIPDDLTTRECYSDCMDVCSTGLERNLSSCTDLFAKGCTERFNIVEGAADQACSLRCVIEPRSKWTCVAKKAPQTDQEAAANRLTTLASYFTLRVTSTTL